MSMKEFRTYHRRSVTKRSGYHVSGDCSGGECIILNSSQYIMVDSHVTFTFIKETDSFIDLFERNIGLLAFAGYINPSSNTKIQCNLSYVHNGIVSKISDNVINIYPNRFNAIGFHKEFALNTENDYGISQIKVDMNIEAPTGTILNFVGFEMGTVISKYYQSVGESATQFEQDEVRAFWKFFNQKTSLSVPYIYYFDTTLPFEKYLIDNGEKIEKGLPVVLKGCNRCSRFIPINIENEIFTLGFALHCKKRAPCNHSTFSKYVILNDVDIDVLSYFEERNLLQTNDEKNIIKSYYGHQLECKPCKKYFVNAKLNPLRDTQQHREDSLRRRAIEILVNNLQDEQLVHFEFRKNNKKEFTEYIWEKFDKRCFKCQKKITLEEMHLDHTMPLAYLYRLDETATCLCAEHNSQKSDHFPIEYYTEEELKELSKITGLSMEMLRSKKANPIAVNLLREKVEWFFDEFLSNPDYQKVRSGKLTADKIYAAIVRVLVDEDIDLVKDYYNIKRQYPKTITIDDTKI